MSDVIGNIRAWHVLVETSVMVHHTFFKKRRLTDEASLVTQSENQPVANVAVVTVTVTAKGTN